MNQLCENTGWSICFSSTHNQVLNFVQGKNITINNLLSVGGTTESMPTWGRAAAGTFAPLILLCRIQVISTTCSKMPLEDSSEVGLLNKIPNLENPKYFQICTQWKFTRVTTILTNLLGFLFMRITNSKHKKSWPLKTHTGGPIHLWVWLRKSVCGFLEWTWHIISSLAQENHSNSKYLVLHTTDLNFEFYISYNTLQFHKTEFGCADFYIRTVISSLRATNPNRFFFQSKKIALKAILLSTLSNVLQ